MYGLAGKTLIPFLTKDIFVLQVACVPLVWAIVGVVSVLVYTHVERPVARYVKVEWIKKCTGLESKQKSENSPLNDESRFEEKTLAEV